jgi:hypothetical protein
MLELLSSGICPLLFGGNLWILKTVRQAFTQKGHPFRPLIFHENIPETLITDGGRMNILGVQQHLIPPSTPDHIRIMHLSDARNNLREAETVIRDSNAMLFDLSVMSSSDLPAQQSSSSSGFCTEEACTLMRFAGLHAQTKAVAITGHDPLSLQLDSSANTAAQLIWYFLEAYNQCISEDPLRSNHYTTYTVHLDQYDTDFRFYKSERTGRWWVAVHAGDQEPVFPCTYHDYSAATNGKLTDRLIACTNASLESSKQPF